MPQFTPRHTPKGLDEFTTGYLECVEWLVPEEVDADGTIIGPAPHATLEGFDPAFVELAKADCADFQQAEAVDLALYALISGRGDREAGHDFWLSRNGHGAGFRDRGNGQVFSRLHRAAKVHGSIDLAVVNNRITST